MSAALKKVTAKINKVTKAIENAARKGKRTKQGEEDLDVKTITALVQNPKLSLEQLLMFNDKEENICPKVMDQENRIMSITDQNDDHQQKSMIGSFIITSKGNDAPEKELKRFFFFLSVHIYEI